MTAFNFFENTRYAVWTFQLLRPIQVLTSLTLYVGFRYVYISQSNKVKRENKDSMKSSVFVDEVP